jgi:hypothetical protein
MRSGKSISISLLIFLAAMISGSACNLMAANVPQAAPLVIVVTATGGPQKTEPPPPPTMEPGLTLTETQTPTVTLTPTLTATLTSSAPTMTAGQDLSCVQGPKFDLYDWVAVIKQGETVTLLAQAPSEWGEYYYVRMSDGTECWAFGGSSTKSGDTASLPVKEAPPTPTPKIMVDYSVSYLSTINCLDNYAFDFQINNTGTLTLESIRIIITDHTTNDTTTHQVNIFRGYTGCVLNVDKPALPPGQGMAVSDVDPGQINYNPAGHSITAAFTICSADGLGGTCVDRTINFTA